MDVDLYRSIGNRKLFVAIRAGMNPALFDVGPHGPLADLFAYRLHFRFDPQKEYVGADAARIARDIERDGFAIFHED